MKKLASALVMALTACIDSTALAQGYVCAEGGGNANKGAWSDEVFGWMVEKGQKGPVVIIGAIPLDDDDRPALFTRLGAASVSSLVVDQSNADLQSTYDAIVQARVVFIRGGDQSRYVNWWAGTKTQAAIKAVFAKGGVIGGTSAGCAVLGEVVFDARKGSLSPSGALQNARCEELTLTPRFLDCVPGVLFDTHFTERGRLPRLAVMLASTATDLKLDVAGLGVDPRTAVCVGPDGVAEIRGEGTVTLLRIGQESTAELEPGQPPAIRKIGYAQWPAGYKVDLKNWEVIARPPYVRHIKSQAQAKRDYGSVPPTTIDGGATGGEPVQYLAGVCVVSRTWTGDATAQAMRAGQMWVSNDPGTSAFWIDAGAKLTVDAEQKVMVGCLGEKRTSLVVLTGDTMSWAGISPTEQPAIEGATLEILPACSSKKQGE